MKVIKKTIHLDDPKLPMILIPVGDLHIGSVNCDKKYLKNTIKWIKDTPNCFVLGMGDYAECIIPTDAKRFKFKQVDKEFLSELDNLPMAQLDYLIDLLMPIREKIIALIPGNHEKKFAQLHYVDIFSELCKRLDVPAGDIMSFIRLDWDRKQFHKKGLTIWAHHGWFGGRKKGNKVNQLEDISNGYSAEIYLAGHSHALFATTTVTISLCGDKMVNSKRIFGNTGSFMKTVSLDGENYSEEKAYPPSKVGVLRFDIYLRKYGLPDVHVRE